MIIPVLCGHRIHREEFPDHTRLIKAPAPHAPEHPLPTLIRRALESPLGDDGLARLGPQSRVIIAFDDPCLPLPLMKKDPRPEAIRQLTERITGRGVSESNIELICANGLHRKWTLKELGKILGKEISERFAGRISCHDGTREDELVRLAKTQQGEPVVLNRKVVDADLTVYVNVNWTPMNGGWKSLTVGLGGYESIREHHNPATILESRSLMDPHRSELHASFDRMGKALPEELNFMILETVINNRLTPVRNLDLEALHRTRAGRMGLRIADGALAASGPALFGKILNLLRAEYEVIDANFGRVESVHPRTLASLARQHKVSVKGQSDILVLGVPDLSPYSSQSSVNPLLVMNLALGYLFNLYRNKPVVRKGGVLVFFNPLRTRFHPVHHPSYVRFFEEVLTKTRDPQEMAEQYEEAFARDPSYLRDYRENYAYFGAHPFFAWYWGACALSHLSKVVVARCEDPGAAMRMGFEPASDLADALRIAGRALGQTDPSITYLQIPPLFIAEVDGDDDSPVS
jgi:hypothetical protein